MASLTPTRPKLQQKQSVAQVAKQLGIEKDDDVDITAFISDQELRKMKKKEKKEKTFDTSKPLEINTADKIDQKKTQLEKLSEKYQTIEQKTDKLVNQMVQREQEKQIKQTAQLQSDDTDSIEYFKQDLLNKNIIRHPTLTLNDVQGMDQLKRILRLNVLAKIKLRSFNTINTILLYSLPGCGKTYIAQAISGSAKLPLITATPSDLMSKWQGESEKLIRALFEICVDNQPCILFLDEFDSMAIERSKSDNESSRRVKNELLQQIDKLPQKVTLIAATNRPFDIDSAIRRRFQTRILVELPDEQLRKSILEKNFQQYKEHFQNYEEILDYLVSQTQKFSNSDVVNLSKKILQQPQSLYIKSGRYSLNENNKYVINPNGEEHDCLEFDDEQIQLPLITLEMIKDVKINKSINIKEENKIKKFEQEYGTGE